MSNDKSFASEVIDLPSHGFYYEQDGPLASGKIELRYMTARDEDILTSRNLISKGVVLDKLMESLIVDKAIKIDDLLVGDKDGIFVASRILGYGAKYPILVTCAVCDTKNEVSADLTKLSEKKVSEPLVKGKNELTFELPYSKKTLTYRLLTHGGEQAITEEMVALNKVGASDVDKTLTTRLKHLIVAVDGDTKDASIRDFIDNQFLARDSRAFREEYNRMSPGMDLSFEFACTKCGDGRRMSLPIGLDFFWPKSEV